VPWPLRSLIKLAMISPQQGAATSIHCATSPEVAGDSGLYYDKCRQKLPSAFGQDRAMALELWNRSEAWVQHGST
jgi:hypothetical protein